MKELTNEQRLVAALADAHKIIEQHCKIIAELEQDNQEQCRLNAMGSEREARLMARVKELEKDASRIDWLEASEEGHGFCHTEFGQYQHYAYKGAVREAIDAAMQKD